MFSFLFDIKILNNDIISYSEDLDIGLYYNKKILITYNGNEVKDSLDLKDEILYARLVGEILYVLTRDINQILTIRLYDCLNLIPLDKFQIDINGKYIQSKCIKQLNITFFIIRVQEEDKQECILYMFDQEKIEKFILKLPQDQDQNELQIGILQNKVLLYSKQQKRLISFLIDGQQQIYYPKIMSNRVYQEFIQNNNTIIIDNNKILTYESKSQNSQFFFELFQQYNQQQVVEYNLTIDNNIYQFYNYQLVTELICDTNLSEFKYNRNSNPFYINDSKDNIQSMTNQYNQQLDYQLIKGQIIIGNTRTQIQNVQNIYHFLQFTNCLILIVQKLDDQKNYVCKYDYENKLVTYLYELPQYLENAQLYYNQCFQESEQNVYINEIYCSCQLEDQQETQIIQEGNVILSIKGTCEQLSLFKDTTAYIKNFKFIINYKGDIIYNEYLSQTVMSLLVLHQNIILVLLEEEIRLYYIDKNNNVNYYSEQYQSKVGYQLQIQQEQISILDRNNKKLVVLERVNIQILYKLLQILSDKETENQVLDYLKQINNSINFKASILIPQLDYYLQNQDILLQILRIFQIDYEYSNFLIYHLRSYDEQLQCITNVMSQWTQLQQYKIIMQIYNKYQNKQFIESVKNSIAHSQPKILVLIMKRIEIDDYEIVKYLGQLSNQMLALTNQQEFDLYFKNFDDNNKSTVLRCLQEIYEIIEQVYELQVFRNNIKSYKNIMSFHVDRSYKLSIHRYQKLIQMILQQNRNQIIVKHIQSVLPQVKQQKEEVNNEADLCDSQFQQTLHLLNDDDEDWGQKKKIKKFKIKTIQNQDVDNSKLHLTISTAMSTKSVVTESQITYPDSIQQDDQQWNNDW